MENYTEVKVTIQFPFMKNMNLRNLKITIHLLMYKNKNHVLN